MKRRTLTTWLAGLLVCSGLAAWADEKPAGGEKQDEINYKELKSPVAFTEKSIARGKMLYMRRCTECHGPDGRSQIDVIADATDLTVPKLYRSGTLEGEVFKSIKEGAGVSMPPFKMQIKNDDDMWHMVNFIRNLWPKDQRPELQPDEANGDDSGDKDKGAEEPSQEGEGT
jgi:mono/diheme cytochrome c family protein